MNEWMILIKYNLLIRVAFVTCRQKKRCWWGRYGSAGNVVLYIKLCRLKAPSVRYRWNIKIKSKLKLAFYIMRVKIIENVIQIKGPKNYNNSQVKCTHTHTHTIQQWELWGMCLIVIKCSKTFLDMILFLDFGLNVTWTCSPENSGKHVHAHVIWKQTLTYWRVCVWRSYTSSRWESPPAPADTGQWEWKPQPEEQPSSSPLCLPPSRHETPDCCYSPLIRETRAKLSLTHPLINDLIDKHIIRYITQYSAHSRSYKNTTK